MTTTRTWFGGNGHFGNASDWSPNGPFQAGDTAVIDTGTVVAANRALHRLTIEPLGTSADTAPVLSLRNVWLDSDVSFPFVFFQDFYATVRVSGVVVSSQSVQLAGRYSTDYLTLDLGRGGVFVNAGKMSAGEGSRITVSDTNTVDGTRGQAAFVNAGTVSLLGAGATMAVDAPVAGNGAFNLQGDPTRGPGDLTFANAVAAGTTVNLANGVLELDQPMRFLGNITFEAPAGGPLIDEIRLPNTTVTSVDFASNQLSLYDGGALVEKLNVAGDYAAADFSVGASSSGGSVITYTTYHPPAATPAQP